jgi:hypothetical protein
MWTSIHHEGTKDTKVSDIKKSNFVLFVTFVVKIAFSSLVAALLRWDLRGEKNQGDRARLPTQKPEDSNVERPGVR